MISLLELIFYFIFSFLPPRKYLMIFFSASLVSFPFFYLLRLPDLVLALVKRFKSETSNEKIDSYQPIPPYFDYAIQYPRELLIFAITLTYSSCAPIITPFGMAYFLLAWICHKYNVGGNSSSRIWRRIS